VADIYNLYIDAVNYAAYLQNVIKSYSILDDTGLEAERSNFVKPITQGARIRDVHDSYSDVIKYAQRLEDILKQHTSWTSGTLKRMREGYIKPGTVLVEGWS